MKKYISLVVLCAISGFVSAQNLLCLDRQIVADCRTVEAVAWNFVMAIVEEDYEKMESVMASEYVMEMRKIAQDNGLTYKTMFDPIYIHDIVGMRPLLNSRWRLVITAIHQHTESFNGREVNATSVSFNCANSDNILYPAYGKTEHDSNTRVVLTSINGIWKVIGFH